MSHQPPPPQVFPSLKFLFVNEETADTGKSFIKQSLVCSGVKSFRLSQGSDERHEPVRGFLWRMWLGGLGGWVRARGGRGEGCEASGRRQEGRS